MQLISRKKQYTANKNTVKELITLESAIPRSKSLEIKDALHTIICLNINKLRTISQHNNKLDICSTTLTMNRKNAVKSDTSYYNMISIDLTRQ